MELKEKKDERNKSKKRTKWSLYKKNKTEMKEK